MLMQTRKKSAIGIVHGFAAKDTWTEVGRGLVLYAAWLQTFWHGDHGNLTVKVRTVPWSKQVSFSKGTISEAGENGLMLLALTSFATLPACASPHPVQAGAASAGLRLVEVTKALLH